MKTKLFVLGAAIALMASCTTTKSVSSTTSTARTLDPETPELVADLEVANMKVTGEFKADFGTDEAVNEQMLKDNAVYNALKTMKADVLVAPQYHVVKETSGRKYYTVTVTGYPAFYRNFRPMPVERIANIELKEINGMVFLITKNNFNEAMGYQIVVPNDKKVQTLEIDQTMLDQVTLDQVILKAREGYTGASVTTSEVGKKEEKENPIAKIVKKASNKTKKTKK